MSVPYYQLFILNSLVTRASKIGTVGAKEQQQQICFENDYKARINLKNGFIVEIISILALIEMK